MVTVLRTNLVTNPSFEGGTSGWAAVGGTLTTSLANDPRWWASYPDVQRGTRSAMITADGTSSYLTIAQDAGAQFAVTAGKWVAVTALIASDALGSHASRGVRADVALYGSGATQYAPSGAFQQSTLYAGRRVTWAFQVPIDVAGARVRLQAFSGNTGVLLAAGQRLWADAVLAVQADTEAAALAALTPYFDGSTPTGPVRPDGSRLVYGWTGTANASASTESLTDAIISAELVSSAGTPPPVQIVLNGIPNDAEYVVTGSTGAGSSWAVPGGTGIGDGGQVVLVDNRAALNIPVTYSVLVGGVTYTADPVTVAHDGRAVLQSLDGLTSVDFVWLSNSLPREPQINTATFNVPGRRRPPVRYAPGGDGGGELLVRADRSNSEAIRELLYSGRPILVRTDGTMRDWPAVELIHLLAAPSRLWEAVEGGQLSTQRVWNLSFLFADDPEPSRVLSAWTWDDFDLAAETSFDTWDEFDALFAGSTFNDFDTTDWGQYQ